MGAVFGLIDYARPARQSPRRLVQHMATIHGQTLARDLKLYADGWIALGYLPERLQTAGVSPVFYQDDRFVVMFDGDILNRASIAAASRIPLDDARAMPQAELICRAFEHRGPTLFDELDGSYRIVVWDIIQKTAYLTGDRNGFRPIFYIEDREAIFFASEVKLLLRGISTLPRLNEQTIADFLAFGHVIDDTTFFANIRQLPAGHFLQLQDGSTVTYRYTDPAEGRGRISDVREAAALLRNAVMMAVKAFSDLEPTGVMLSGGVDSRLIAGAQHRLGYPSITFTTGENGSADVALATATARILGAEYHYHPLTGDDFLENFCRAVWLQDGLLNGYHSEILGLVPLLKNRPLRLLEGMNPIDGAYRMADLSIWRFRKWNLAQQMWLAEKIFPQTYRRDDPRYPAGKLLREETVGNVLSVNERLQGLIAHWDFSQQSPAEAIHTLDKNVRQRFLTAFNMNLLRHYVRISNPLYTFAVADIVSRLPVQWKSREKVLLRRIISELNPQLAAIPWQRTMLHLKTKPAFEYLMLAAKLLNRHIRFHRPEQGENSPFEQQPLFNFSWHLNNNPSVRLGVRYLLFGILPDEILNRQTVRNLYVYATRHRVNLDDILGRIMSINLWYRYFVLGHNPTDDLFAVNIARQDTVPQ